MSSEGSELRQRGVQSQSDDANKTAPAVAEAPPPNPIAPMFKVDPPMFLLGSILILSVRVVW